jgi:hypothetical protein
VIGYMQGALVTVPSYKRREVADMSTFQAISLMIAFSMFLVSLLSLVISIIKLNERKK